MKVLKNLKNIIENFKVGSISSHFSTWVKITSDKWLLDLVKNRYSMEFESEPSVSGYFNQPTFSKKEAEIISQKIEKLIKMDVLKSVVPCADQFLSNIFLLPKHDGGHRLILNLKHLNEFVEKHHFKMETLKIALSLVKPNAFFRSLGLRQAYYSLPIYKERRKFLRFIWDGVIYEYSSLPKGLSAGPRIFSKFLKPMNSALRKLGHTNVAYIDDSFLQSDTYDECVRNISDSWWFGIYSA